MCYRYGTYTSVVGGRSLEEYSERTLRSHKRAAMTPAPIGRQCAAQQKTGLHIALRGLRTRRVTDPRASALPTDYMHWMAQKIWINKARESLVQ